MRYPNYFWYIMQRGQRSTVQETKLNKGKMMGLAFCSEILISLENSFQSSLSYQGHLVTTLVVNINETLLLKYTIIHQKINPQINMKVQQSFKYIQIFFFLFILKITINFLRRFQNEKPLYNIFSKISIMKKSESGQLFQEEGLKVEYILIQQNIIYFKSHMSKPVAKTQKVTIDEEQSSKITFENAPKLFSKWSYDDIKIEDPCFIDYIAAKSVKAQVFVPHTAGRYQAKKFRKALCPIIERLVGSLQFHGRNTGKKAKAIRIVRHTFEIIHLLTGRNPLQVVVNALLLAGPREDSTRIGAGGVVRKQAVDVSPLRRVNQAIYLITQGAREHSFKATKTIAECLADEIINVEKNNIQSSYALKKKEQIEKVAKGNR